MTEIKAGNCYMCLEDIKGYDSFTKGKVYPSLYNNALINDNHIEVLVRPSDYFRIATKQEIIAQKGNSMTKQETIQVLQSIEDRAIRFPNMTECDWVAIASAKRHLQEEPVSEDLKERKSKIILEGANFNKSWYAHPELAFIAGAKWDKERIMAKAVDGYVIEDIEEGNGDFLLSADYLPKSMGLKDHQRVKVIVIKEE